MLIPASSVAALAVLLCVNLARGYSDVRDTGGRQSHHAMFPATDLPTADAGGTDGVFLNTTATPPRTVASRSENGEEIVTDGTDMVMTREQYRRLYQGTQGRSAGKSAFKPWTYGRVHYIIMTSQFTKEQVAWIKRAMKNWQDFTCVKFIPYDASSKVKNRLVIKKGSGCSAFMGMKGGEQSIILGDECFWKGTIEHELGHALGLIHEHQRYNRDDYLRVNYFAANPQKIFDLVKYNRGSDDKYGLPYDYNSVMHYSKTEFSKVWNTPTMHAKMANKTDVIGQALKPSFYDYKLINLMYKCRRRCRKPPYCPEPCFVNATCGCVCEHDIEKEVCADLSRQCGRGAEIGDCKRFSILHHKCRKTCGLCKEDGTAPQLPCVDFSRGCTAQSCASIASARYCEKTCHLCVDNNRQDPCEDKFDRCPEWAEAGACDRHPEMMLTSCRRSCDFCLGERLPQGQCEDFDTICNYFKAMGGCVSFPAILGQDCRKACGNCDNRLSVSADCQDSEDTCFKAAWEGKCGAVSGKCKRSCNHCPLTVTGSCLDKGWKCPMYRDQCEWNPEVQTLCPRTCNLCMFRECTDSIQQCKLLKHQCATNGFLQSLCQRTCQVC